MTRLLTILSLFLALTLHAQTRTNVTLAWDYPTNILSTNLTFVLYCSATPNTPLNTWTFHSAIVGTNLQATIPVTSQQNYFTLKVTNNIGEESPFSNVAVIKPPAGHLRILQ